MAPPAVDKGRVVVVAAGFALWVGGRCVAAARWADIQRLRANQTAAGSLALRVEMTDGTVLELDEAAPGFDLFLDRAAVVLHGLAPFKSWHPALAAAGSGGQGVVIFERLTRRR
jgi:hypothetical protein